MENKNLRIDKFITQEMFLNLAECIIIVCGTVELFKKLTPYPPLILNLIISSFVTLVRIAIIGDFSFKGILLGIFNLIPIMLGSTGIYEFAKNILGGGN